MLTMKDLLEILQKHWQVCCSNNVNYALSIITFRGIVCEAET
jgi:hypothetical protein